MTTPSPLAGKTGLLTYSIKVDGQALPDTCRLSQLRVHKEVNRIAQARVCLFDGDPSSGSFELSAGKLLVPGGLLSISAGYHGLEKMLFEGLIVKHGIRVRSDHQSTLVLTCYDKAVKLTQGRKSASLGKSDRDIVQAILSEAGLDAKVETTSALHDGVVRYYATDWDFIVSRAETNGKIVLVDDGKVSVAAPVCSGEAVLRIAYGDALQEIEAEIDARHQHASVQCEAWDFATQKVLQAKASEPSVNEQGDLAGKKLAAVLGLPAFRMQSATPVPDAELKAWADAQLLKSRMARLRGSVTCRGNALPKPGSLVELDGLGDRFNGKAFVSRVIHRIEEGDWSSEIGFGMSPEWFVAENPDVSAPRASGMLPGIEGLQIGVVRKIDADPDGQTRIQVDAPMIGLDGEGIWARLASAYASKDAGIFFVPEIGDEVVLGFLNGNPSFPIVLGSLYSGAHTPPYAADAPNTNKAIVTKGKIRIAMDDVKARLRIETPGKHIITLHDDDKTLTIVDANNNKLVMSPSGIAISSPYDISIKADGNLQLKAGMAVSVSAGTQLDCKAPNVSAKADMALSMQGQASAELSSSGQATVRAPMVMIN